MFLEFCISAFRHYDPDADTLDFFTIVKDGLKAYLVRVIRLSGGAKAVYS